MHGFWNKNNAALKEQQNSREEASTLATVATAARFM